MTLAKAWSLAVKSMQFLLMCATKGVKMIRGQKKRGCIEEIVNLENRVNQGDVLAQTRSSLDNIEDKEP